MCAWNASSEPVEAVLFDLGNTLVHYYKASEFAPVLERCVAAAARTLAADVDVAAAQAQALVCNAERADFAVWPIAERLERVFGVALPPGPLLEAVTHAFLEPIFAIARVAPGALATLISLRKLGLKIAVVSNTPWGSPAAAWRAELARHGILEQVDATVFCVDVGWRKPARAPFERALAALGAEPSRSWFVGDDEHWDVVGARGAGLTPILIGSGDLQADCEVIPELRQLETLVSLSRSKR